jgi:FRG domain-containing protein
MYRGQTNTWRLRTPFHRTGRGDMRNFFLQDIPALHRSLSARTSHVFDLSDPIQNAAFLNMVQHHGYPTPLLDWTYSPFVATYFAYRRVSKSDVQNRPDEKVRIFIFDAKEWRNSFSQVLSTVHRLPHFSLIEPIAIENERLIPQQALSSFTTVDDIESYIHEKENETKKQFIQMIDLPIGERDLVIRELTLMGVTAGSLFPGLEGTCEEIRERFFSF